MVRLGRGLFLLPIIAAMSLVSSTASAADDQLDALLERTAKQVASFLDVMSETNCTERVVQQKLASNGKVVAKQASTYDYLIMISTEGGDLNLVESRLASDGGKQQTKSRSALLISNGFSTLFLVFHPYYAPGFNLIEREKNPSMAGR